MSITMPSPLTLESKLPVRSATASSTTGASDSSSSQTSLSSLGTTFMQLLVQELQNQDPTAPMDSTQMVGQMISLNQLDQVASINQLLTNTLGSSTTTSSSSKNSLSSLQAATQQAATLAAQQATSGLKAGSVQLPTLSTTVPLN